MGIISPADVWYPATAEDADAAADDDGHIPPPIRFVDSKSLHAVGWNRAARAEAAALGAALLVTEAAVVAADLRARMPAVRESMVAGSCFGFVRQSSRSCRLQKRFSIDAPAFRCG